LSVVRKKLKIKRQMFVSSEGESKKETVDLSVVKEKVKIKRQMIVSNEKESEDKETDEC